MNQSIINFIHISKTFDQGRSLALKDINFSVQAGEFFCIVGPSGCGKSTILKIIAGLEAPTGGEIEKPADVAMVFQSGALLPWLSVYDNAAFGLRSLHATAAKVKQETSHFIELVGLSDFAQKFPRDLSGGQRQRVGLARALAVDPKVLLLDEPFSALDTVTTEELHRDLLKIWQKMKMTVVMVSHSIEEAVTLADRIMLMKAGNVEETFNITLPYPRREQADLFIRYVHQVRNKFFK